MRFCKKYLDELLTWKWSLLFILMYIVGFNQRHNISNSSIYIQSRINLWDIIIGITGDPFMNLYLILPFMLLLSCLTVRETFNTNYLVRLRSWRQWVLYSVKIFSPVVVVSTTLLLITSFLLTLGLPYETNWSPFSLAELSSFNDISFYSRQSNLSPYLVIILQQSLLYIFLLSMHAFIATLYLYFSNLVYLGTISFAILLYALLSFRYIPEFPKLITFNYMTFHSSYVTYHAVYPAFVTLVGILIICIYVIPLLKKWRW